MIAGRVIAPRLLRLSVASLVYLAIADMSAAATTQDDLRTAFDWTCGTWEGFRSEAKSGRREQMTMRIESILGGVGQLRHIEIGAGENAYRGFAVQVPAVERGRWVRQYTNSKSGSFSPLEGELKGDGTSVWRGVSAERTRESRLVSERLGRDLWRRTMSVSSDSGSTWTGLWIDELQRRRGEEGCRGEPRRMPAPAAVWEPGARISLSLKEADLTEVLRSFAQMAGFNLGLDPSVRGAVTVELQDVPWERALEVILESHGLAAEVDGVRWRVGRR